MIRYECDRCGAKLGPNDDGRYIVKIEIYAAAGPMEFSEEEVARSTKSLDEVLRELADADPDELEDQTYRVFRFDVCEGCRRALVRQPLGGRPHGG